MQILRPEGRTHYYLSNKQTKQDQVVCIEELKLALLAKSCICPGLPAMIYNLISSTDFPAVNPNDGEWLEEYLKGKSFEIYRVFLPTKYKGKSFSWIAHRIYRSFHAILFAIEIITPDGNKIFINPGNHILQGLSKITGYIIAQNKDVDDLLTNYQAFVIEETESFRRSRRNGRFISRSANRKPTITIERTFMQMDNEDEDDDEEAEAILKRNDQFSNSIGGNFSRIEGKYHLAPSKIAFSDITFKTMRNNILATNHIILCGVVPNLNNFIAPLRLKYIEKIPPIIILHPVPPTEKQWTAISMYPEIYYVKGSAMSHKDLLKANIMFAKSIVILAPDCSEINRFLKFDTSMASTLGTGTNNQDDSSKHLTKDQEDLLDAKTIFKYKAITKLRPDIQTIVELVSSNNTAFLINDPKDYAIMRKFGFSQAPIYASGSIYLSSMFDYLICQSFYNSSIINLLTHLIMGNPKSHSHNPKHKYLDIYGSIKTSNLFHFPVPHGFIGHTFEKLFEYLLKNKNILPLGLYRKTGCKDNFQPYVYTNPDPDTILTIFDMIFILSEKEPPQNSNEWNLFDETEQIASKPIEKKKEEEEIGVNVHEDVEKDNIKAKQVQKDTEPIMKKITDLVNDLKNLKDEIDILKKVANDRQNVIIDKIKLTIDQSLNELLSKIDFKDIQEDFSEDVSMDSNDTNYN